MTFCAGNTRHDVTDRERDNMPEIDDFVNPYEGSEPPPKRPRQGRPSDDNKGDSTGGVIPYKNPPALIAYYLGLFSLFPLFGLLLAIPAFILGIKGLKLRRENPAVKGSVHAWIGIVMGGLMTLLWGGGLIMIIIGLMAQQ